MSLHPAYLLLAAWWVSVNRGNFSTSHTQKPSEPKPAGHTHTQHTHSSRARHLENGKWVKIPPIKVQGQCRVKQTHTLCSSIHWVKCWGCVITCDAMGGTFGALSSEANNTRSDHAHLRSGTTDGICNFSRRLLLKKHWQSSLEPRDSISQIKRCITTVLCPTCWALPCDTGSTKQPEACTPVPPLQHHASSHVNKASRGNIIFTALARRAAARDWGFMLHKNLNLIHTCCQVHPQTWGCAPWPVIIILIP